MDKLSIMIHDSKNVFNNLPLRKYKGLIFRGTLYDKAKSDMLLHDNLNIFDEKDSENIFNLYKNEYEPLSNYNFIETCNYDLSHIINISENEKRIKESESLMKLLKENRLKNKNKRRNKWRNLVITNPK